MEKYTLIVTEKPLSAQRIAEALDLRGKPEKIEENNVPYFIAYRDTPLAVVPALGHLYTVVQEHRQRGSYPIVDFKWAPRYLAEKSAHKVKACIEVFSRLAAGADEFVDACDYDIEGATIGYTILKYACDNKENAAKRMKYSTLTQTELKKSYEEKISHLDFPMIEAGLARHEVDWLYGINMSRALTTSIKRSSGQYITLSTGRVQGPTLGFLVAREQSIKSFVPTPYWTILAEVDIEGTKYTVDYEKNAIREESEADAVVESCKGKSGQIDRIEEKTIQITAPIPFDLSSLQSEAYSLFGYPPYRTSDIAEGLYLDALISYPRTSSQKLPPAINYRDILSRLSRYPKYEKLVTTLVEKQELTPMEGAKTDPAHPAIYPTGNLPTRTVDESERRIWDLVNRRFMAVFGEPAVKQIKRAAIIVNDYRFHINGKRILKDGWMQFYRPYVRVNEAELPPIKETETVRVTQIRSQKRFTEPPPRYNPNTLLKRMEKEGIGTKATRANIIKTLYNRKYIKNERMVVTDLGLGVIEVLRQHAQSVTSINLTRELEEKMDQIQSGTIKRESVLREVVERLTLVLTEWRQQEKGIGDVLNNAIKNARVQDRVISECPSCHKGKLIILYSLKTRKRFVGCTNYRNGCKATFSLPQRCAINPVGKDCEVCGWPLLLAYFGGRHSWVFCFNPHCPKRKERTRKYP